MTFSPSEDSNQKTKNEDDDDEFRLPLIEKYMPNRTRHEIFLNKLNTV